MQIREPVRVRRSYTQSLQAEPDAVFPLLCPVREADWVRGWTPELVLSSSGVIEPGCHFTLEDGSVWIVTRHDPRARIAEMWKLVPGLYTARITLSLSSDGKGGTLAEVVYTWTALSGEGEAFVAERTQPWYAQFMKEWEHELNHYLRTGDKLAE